MQLHTLINVQIRPSVLCDQNATDYTQNTYKTHTTNTAHTHTQQQTWCIAEVLHDINYNLLRILLIFVICNELCNLAILLKLNGIGVIEKVKKGICDAFSKRNF